ncbi:amidohydrolase [Kordiimonas pumila]|uniref:Amidohydrolase n=1 Tax=Kordiimonas pumila TaxID=2161677 RepID=A0ABV7D5J6_9PROT|nr:amidohydrolase [Kordiimonas pumila]
MTRVTTIEKGRVLAGFLAATICFVQISAGADDGYQAPYKRDPYASTYIPRQAPDVAIIGAKALTGTGAEIENATIVLTDGKITAIGGPDTPFSASTTVIEASGKWVTPGIIDVHSHLGIGPIVESYKGDVNEKTSPITAEAWAEHAIWPQDPGFARALAGGVTTLQILPGSANLIGGRGVSLKNVPAVIRSDMKFPGAPQSLKMACGENPISVYGGKSGPGTRMAMMAGYRKAWIKASAYKAEWDAYEIAFRKGQEAKLPTQDLQLDTLAAVLDGRILVHNHCYRADEMAAMIQMSHEFGYQITAFHHAVESYKIADLLTKEGICSAMWADWWGAKMEAYDSIDENIPMVASAGACAIVHSDSADNIQRLNIDAARAWADGRAVGLNFTKAQAFEWLTLNPAKSLGIADQTGSLEVGKMADVVIWSGDPFSIYTEAEKVFIDGTLYFDTSDPSVAYQSDYETGLVQKGEYQ